MATKRKNGQLVVIIPVAKVMIPPRMDNNPFYRNELLTAFYLIHVVLTCHNSVFTGVWTDGGRRDQFKSSLTNGSDLYTLVVLKTAERTNLMMQ